MCCVQAKTQIPTPKMLMSDSPAKCPVCDEARNTSTRLYQHLQVSHRKSAVAKALIDATSDESDSSGEEALVKR